LKILAIYDATFFVANFSRPLVEKPQVWSFALPSRRQSDYLGGSAIWGSNFNSAILTCLFLDTMIQQ
jgi:hypothetical protein